MAGRCTECGTYHYDGPPCDNCGEMGFTEAPKVMKCAECGEIHLDGNPPCDACGEMGFRRVENPGQHLDDGKTPEEHREELREFGREEGGLGVDRRTVVYGLGAVGVLGAGYYAFTSSDDYPTKEVAGEPDAAASIRFETAETEILGLINDERSSQSLERLSRPENVDAFAEYWNKTRVEEGNGVASGEFDGDFNVDSYHGFTNRYSYEGRRAIETYDSAEDLAQGVFGNLQEREKASREMTSYEWTRVGIDLHVGTNGDVFYTVVFA